MFELNPIQKSISELIRHTHKHVDEMRSKVGQREKQLAHLFMRDFGTLRVAAPTRSGHTLLAEFLAEPGDLIVSRKGTVQNEGFLRVGVVTQSINQAIMRHQTSMYRRIFLDGFLFNYSPYDGSKPGHEIEALYKTHTDPTLQASQLFIFLG